MKVSVDWLKDYAKIKGSAEKAADRLTMAGLEVEKVHEISVPKKDSVFEVEVTTNRPDWLSHIGVAREMAAVDDLSLQLPTIENVSLYKKKSAWQVAIDAKEACPYYTGILIEGIQNHETPAFMKNRLEACGLRSIDLIVDITNYVLLETGQPLHAFDADLLLGNEINVRFAKKGERFTAIDGKALELKTTDLVIADAQRAVALAGVMGGKDTEVSATTKNLFLESALFDPASVRRTSHGYGLISDSSYRFERRVDPEGIDFARDRALWLIKKYAKPAAIYSVVKEGKKPLLGKTPLTLKLDDIERVLGVSMKQTAVASYLKRLGLSAAKKTKDALTVKVPSFRAYDLTRPVDLIEEVARIHGFENIPEQLPARVPLLTKEDDVLKLQDKARDFFSGVGLFETVTFSLISSKGFDEENDFGEAVCIENPQNKELRWMRPSLVTSFLEVIKKNRSVGRSDVFLFELGKVYAKSSKGKNSKENRVLGIALSGYWQSKTWMDQEREVSFYDLKGILNAFLDVLGLSSDRVNYEQGTPAFSNTMEDELVENLLIHNKQVGVLGQVNQSCADLWDIDVPVYYAEINLDALAPAVNWIHLLKELPRFPGIERDMSITVDESVKASEIAKMFEPLGQGLIKDVRVFDLFRGGRIPKGQKNLSFRVLYQASDRTLVSQEIQDLHASIAEEIIKTFQASFQ